jgi:N-acetylmuramoyl-L-alanine amidase
VATRKLKILIQKGHVAPREPGFEGGTGTVREQELVTLIANRLDLMLRMDGRFETVVVPGDIPDGIRVDAALFLHGDGSANRESSGFCFGYPDYQVNKKLAALIADEFEDIPGHPPHHKDNYTRNLSGYYGFSRVATDGPEVLVEHGFLTNPAEQKWLFANVGALARAEYRALLRYFTLSSQVKRVIVYDVFHGNELLLEGATLVRALRFTEAEIVKAANPALTIRKRYK